MGTNLGPKRSTVAAHVNFSLRRPGSGFLPGSHFVICDPRVRGFSYHGVDCRLLPPGPAGDAHALTTIGRVGVGARRFLVQPVSPL